MSAAPSKDLFTRERDPECEISEWQAHRWALNEMSDVERAAFEARTRNSAASRKILAEVEAARRSSAGSLAPAQIVRPHQGNLRRRDPFWMWVGALAVPAMALVLFFSVPRPSTIVHDETVRAKGEASLKMGVRDHDGNVAVMEVREVSVLQAGDKLRFHAVGTKNWLQLEVETNAGWQAVFVGAVKSGDWIPLGFEVTAGAPVRLRWRLCKLAKKDDPPRDCASSSASIPVESPP
ncbi:MAG: hypothetical protein SF187_21415 [Deltaproteobacteria bacterium]|nr:hypothetical protein [Deltaproteobacteria bacterium]